MTKTARWIGEADEGCGESGGFHQLVTDDVMLVEARKKKWRSEGAVAKSPKWSALHREHKSKMEMRN